MDSVPPARMALALPVMIAWAPMMMALREEAQTLFTVVQTVESGMPAPMAHCRAGFWPRLGEGELVTCGCRGERTLLRGHCRRGLRRFLRI